jgi:hypothetical protein
MTQLKTLKVASEHPEPGQGAQHRRHDERQQHRRPRYPRKAESPIEQDSEPHPERRLEHGCHEGEEHRVPRGGTKDVAIQQPQVIPEADELAGRAYQLVGQRHPDAEHERVRDEHEDQDQCRAQEHEREDLLVLEERGDPTHLRGADRTCLGTIARDPSRVSA